MSKTYTYLEFEIKYNKPSIGDAELNLRRDASECNFNSLSKDLMNMKICLRTRANILNALV